MNEKPKAPPWKAKYGFGFVDGSERWYVDPDTVDTPDALHQHYVLRKGENEIIIRKDQIRWVERNVRPEPKDATEL